jgi:hypothetical protein
MDYNLHTFAIHFTITINRHHLNFMLLKIINFMVGSPSPIIYYLAFMDYLGMVSSPSLSFVFIIIINS